MYEFMYQGMIVEKINVKLVHVSGHVRDFLRLAGLEKYFGLWKQIHIFMKLLVNLIKLSNFS
jgi:hypothetical protein